MAVSVTIIVVDDIIPTGTPLENVVVHVWSEDGITFVTSGTTDLNGEVVFLLDDLTNFWLRFLKWEYAFDTRLRIPVDGVGTYDVVGRDLVRLPPSAVPELCRASGVVVNAAGEPAGGATFRFDATSLPVVVADRATVSSSVTVFSSKDGYVEVELIRGGVYDVTVSGHEDETIRIKVPDQEAVAIADLIWPYVVSVTYSTNPANIVVGETIEIQATVLLSSGVTTPYDLDDGDDRHLGDYTQWNAANAGIAGVSIDPVTDVFTIVGSDAGTVMVTVTLLPNVEVDRLPAPTRDIQDLIINVS